VTASGSSFGPGHDQAAHRVRCEWGPTGARAVSLDGAVAYAVVVDVLSFTTTLTVALEQGIEVFPHRWRDSRAAEHAVRHGATLAVGRFEALTRRDARHVSLSPASIAAAEGIERLVLPSPNGSTIAFELAEAGVSVLGACLRNAEAVAAWLAPRLEGGADVALVPAGERWPDESLRPAVEDLWGAGAVIAGLVDRGVTGLSPEARQAERAFRAARLPDELAELASAVELREGGFGDDVAVAGEVGASEVVPLLAGESFADARG
jgi:2-phosphosulfolactate phosphatase